MPKGDQSTGSAVITAFEHAYYVERSADTAHALVSSGAPPDAPFANAENLRAGIDSIPTGTSYCLQIESLRPDAYSVTVTEARIDGPGPQYRQRITTSTSDGRYYITVIAPA